MGQISMPPKGMAREDVLNTLKSFKSDDVKWQNGQLFGLIYETGTDLEDVLKEAHCLFLIENGLNPAAFPSLVRLESEVVSIVAGLSGGDDETVGNLTTGGTESIFMALKAARDWARERHPNIRRPEMVVPVSAHPAWNKAAHYLGIKIVMTPIRDDLRADVAALKDAITKNTIILGATAVTYPHGVVDPVEEIAALALGKKIWLHVDACLGGLMLPFLKRLEYDIPAYDFSIPGVSSLSADIHKYAYTPKGVSAVMYRNRDLRKFQIFAYADWPGGVYATPCLAGGRPGGMLAAAWAAFHYLGEEGFVALAQKAKAATETLISGIDAIPQLYVLGRPDATVFAFSGKELHIYELASKMATRGWHIEAQQLPPSLHMTVSPVHFAVADKFLDDLQRVLPEVPRADSNDLSEQAAMYAMLNTMPDRGMAKDFAVEYINNLYRVA
ncbi:MAG: aspartate aminotransferase family protein [Deltaproteobacteria bacterium]|jgi:glutamate/tyrosine decarboxylase-like PLP-dependent enzyme|nr:aspartate aminotransferase family protein [Deltaproteobacteria bacterium]